LLAELLAVVCVHTKIQGTKYFDFMIKLESAVSPLFIENAITAIIFFGTPSAIPDWVIQ
jgi:hypothetical protein